VKINSNVIEYPDPPSIARPLYVSFYKTSLNCIHNRRYDWVIGVAEPGLIASAVISRRWQIPYAYWNLELHIGHERPSFTGRLYGQCLKCFERWANQQATITVTQDHTRGRFLAKLNRLERGLVRHLPNSRRGSAALHRSTWIHDNFGLPSEARIVLWIGGTSPGDGALELAQAARFWPHPYWAVFHFRSKDRSQYMRAITACHGQGRVIVSREPIPYEMVDDLAYSAHVGLGLYADKGINARYIGASSGKVNLFLKAGIPCVVSDYEGLRWVQKHGGGECVRDVSNVLAAVKRIDNDYARYCNNAITLFQNALNFDEPFSNIADEMEGICKSQRKEGWT